jgi:diguanylate cyclase (GGDEF)-like protein
MSVQAAHEPAEGSDVTIQVWELSLIASLAIAIPYFAIAYFIARGLARSGQLRRNRLGLATALIFCSCGTGHLIHAGHLLEGGVFRRASDLHMTLWDLSTAAIAVWYLSLRGRYGQLLQGPAMFEDHERAAAEAQARHESRHDHLTGLLNRQALMDALEHALDPRVASGRRAVLFVDFDGFKAINDRYGHQAGDELLVAAAERLRGALRPSDVLARLGGDEFVTLLDGASTDEQAIAIARRQEEALSAPFTVEGEPATITISIGIALGSPGELSASELLHRADVTMYSAKGSRGTSHRLYAPELVTG